MAPGTPGAGVGAESHHLTELSLSDALLVLWVIGLSRPQMCFLMSLSPQGALPSSPQGCECRKGDLHGHLRSHICKCEVARLYLQWLWEGSAGREPSLLSDCQAAPAFLLQLHRWPDSLLPLACACYLEPVLRKGASLGSHCVWEPLREGEQRRERASDVQAGWTGDLSPSHRLA